jgi:hypothetical protein
MNQIPNPSPEFFQQLGILLSGTHALQEHAAQHVQVSLAGDADNLIDLGFKLVFETDTVKFLQHSQEPWRRIEIIGRDVPVHEAWAFPAVNHFEIADGNFNRSTNFEEVSDQRSLKPELHRCMYRHIASGVVIQLLWRKVQIFDGVFPADTGNGGE